ncbi:DUF1878 family protein [Neobacillus niacini]|uniref:DUF1878 family protein n=1 Tax=Neobacillus niacini TaxID=86668 RepID=UPI00285E4488|nr:DUF1878 family protein [Neobacillus niacini]MDR7001307.1 Glu-tRNA(Gln) amidotransferase subunit E-like FAD-binding protein [Neobacillus niacini]
MENHELQKRIQLLEYHQKILLALINNPKQDFYRMIIEKGLSEQEVREFMQICDELSIKMEEQKAEGFVHFQPLFTEFLYLLSEKLDSKEIIQACSYQGIYLPLMLELKKYLYAD